MDHRHELLSHFGITAFGDGVMVIATRLEAGVGAPIVSDEQGSGCDGILGEAAQRVGAAVLGDGKSKPTGIAAILPFVLGSAGLAMADLDGSGNQRLVMDAPAFTARPAADPSLVHFNMGFRQSADPIAVRSDHTGAEFVEKPKRCLIPAQSKLPLELDGRHAGRLTGEQIRSPEPGRERHMATLHDRTDRQAGVFAAGPAPQNAGTIFKAEGVADDTTVGASEAISPPRDLKIGRTGRIVGKQPLELWQRLREGQTGVLMGIGNHLFGFADKTYGSANREWVTIVGNSPSFTDSIAVTLCRHVEILVTVCQRILAYTKAKSYDPFRKGGMRSHRSVLPFDFGRFHVPSADRELGAVLELSGHAHAIFIFVFFEFKFPVALNDFGRSVDDKIPTIDALKAVEGQVGDGSGGAELLIAHINPEFQAIGVTLHLHFHLHYPLHTHTLRPPPVGVKRIMRPIREIQYLVGVGKRRIGKDGYFFVKVNGRERLRTDSKRAAFGFFRNLASR